MPDHLPDFVICGGVASGTSFLSVALTSHPDIYIPRQQRPEPNYFHYSWKHERGLEWYSRLLFSEYAGETVKGERSSLLLNSEPAPHRMREAIPDAKLIFCLRNPIERAWANYRFTVLEGLEPLSFADAISKEEERCASAEGIWAEVQPHAYVKRSKYAAQLETYLDLFGADQILILSSEQMSRETESTLARVCSFLGVRTDAEFELPVSFTSPTVVDRSVQVELREYFGDRFSEIIECIRTEQPISAELTADTDEVQLKRLVDNLGSGKESLPDADRARLQDLLASDIGRVAELVDFSLDGWK